MPTKDDDLAVETGCVKGDGHQGFGWDSDFEIRSLTLIFFKISVVKANYHFLILFKYLFFL